MSVFSFCRQPLRVASVPVIFAETRVSTGQTIVQEPFEESRVLELQKARSHVPQMKGMGEAKSAAST